MKLLVQNITLLEEYDTLAQVKFNSIRPHIEDAQKKWLKPILGKEFLTELANDHDNTNNEALHECRNALVPLAVALFIPESKAKITPSGMQATVSNTTKTAYAGDVQDMVEARIKRGARNLEYLLEFLEENKDDYTTWKNGHGKELKNRFVQSAIDINSAYNINANRFVYINLLPSIKKAEEGRLKQVLGDDLYNEMVTAMKDGTSAHESILPLAKESAALLAIHFGVLQNIITTNFNGNWVLQSFEAITSAASGRKLDSLSAAQKKELQQETLRMADDAFFRLRTHLNKLALEGSLDVYKNSAAYKPDAVSGFKNTSGRKFFNGCS